MSESETEDEILDRLESALRKIAGLSGAPRLAEGEPVDRAALAAKLDRLISRLRGGLEPALRPGNLEPALRPEGLEPSIRPGPGE